jgi:hypothetical protein
MWLGEHDDQSWDFGETHMMLKVGKLPEKSGFKNPEIGFGIYPLVN